MADIHSIETSRDTRNPLLRGNGIDTIDHCVDILNFIEAAVGARHDDGIQGGPAARALLDHGVTDRQQTTQAV